MASAELDQKIQDVHRKIQVERSMLDSTMKMRQVTGNQSVLKSLDTKIREAESSLSYFESTLRELQARKIQLASGGPDPGRSALTPSTTGLPPTPYPKATSPRATGREGQYSPENPYPGAMQPSTKQYSSLDLLKAETPLTPARISRMLHQLEFKLQVEKQYKAGIDKMAMLYQADGDKRSRADAEAKRVESERKIAILEIALKRYKTLHVLDVVDEEEDDGPPVDGQRKENLRNKPQSGKLQISLKAARDLEHTPIVNTGKSRSSSKKVIETYITIKVEGTQHARSHPSRTDRWMEDFDIPVDKANEIEIALYDKQVSEPNPVPIGLLWIRITDILEANRRQKVLMESGQGNWVTAGAMPNQAAGAGGNMMGSTGDMVASGAYGDGPTAMNMAPSGSIDGGVEAWFAVEPVGAVALHLNFVKENVRKRALDRPGGLGRQGAVRARKEEVHEMNGHQFVQRQFYQIVLCAFCNEFLLNAVGYQCEDCKYTCHKKCYEKVVTKCISKSTAGEDEEKINHRIPHRFEFMTNMGTKWCCHCGMMLPFGRKNAKRCSECDITCHATCAHLVPDFCGMSMETANILLAEWRDINRQRGGKAGRPLVTKHQSQRPSVSAPHDQQVGQMGQDFDRMRLQGGPQAPATGEQGRPPQSPPMGALNMDPRYTQQQPTGAPPGYPGGPTSPHAQRPPPSGRTSIPSTYPEAPSMPVPTAGSESYGYDRPPQAPPKPYPASATSPSQGRQQALPPSPHVSPAVPIKQQTQAPPAQARLSQAAAPQTPARPSKPKRKVGLDDFNFLAVLGKGNFGKVMLAEEKKSTGLYAIKVLKKEFIIENDEVESTKSEKRVFQAAARERHPFLLGLHSCFQTETRIYFVMEYVSGGDLMLHIQRKQFSLRQAKFYACEVALALEYFHANGIVYRDLKLDNILLTLDGHVKVADYGLCKEDMWHGATTSTFCGTPEFMAPEILLEQRYGRAVDWWAFGVLMYEMLLGQSPFRGDDEDEIFDAILEDEPLYPITMPRDAVAVLQKLLTRDPARRLGSGKTDAEEIKSQPFFKDVSWDDVFHKRIPPPYFPTINGSADTSNFDEEFTKEQPTLTPVTGQLTARDQQEFGGFSWVADWADH